MINTILRFSIARRHLMLFLCLVIIAAGLWSYQRLPIDAVPDITNVQVQINTSAPGYSPLEVEQRVTYPIETALYGLPNLDYTRSLSRYGLSQVTVVFDEGTDIYFARNLINTRLASIGSVIPEGIEPEMGPISTGLGEIFMYTVTADPSATRTDGLPYSPQDLREIQDWIIKPQLAQVDGVVEVNSIGGYDKQYHVLPDTTQMLNLGVTLEDINRALAENNDNRGAGFIERHGQQLLVRSPGQLATLRDIENVIVKNVDQAPVRIRNVAEVAIGNALRTGAATANGEETVLGTAMMLLGENSRTVAEDVAERLTEIQGSLPEGVHANAVYDRTALVDRAIATVSKNLIEGALLVIAVLFALLGNLRAALITAAVIPLTMLMTLTGMVRTGVSANLMSLGALDFGLIVDGAVIIVENAVRRLSLAQQASSDPELPLKQRLKTVYEATAEVIRPSVFGIVIITAVYLPIFALSGVEGKMFHPMAITVTIALLCAMVLSFTFVPAAVAVLMKKPVQEKESLLIRSAKSLYEPILSFALKARALLAGIAVLLVAGSLWLATHMGTEFIPQLDEGDFAVQAIRITGTSLEQSVAMQRRIEKALIEMPEIESAFTRIGTAEIATDPMPPNIGDGYVILSSREEWPDPEKPKTELIAEAEAKLNQIPGSNYEYSQPIELRFNELISGVRADLGIKLFGDDFEVLGDRANDILAQVNQTPGAADARIEQVDGLPTLSIIPKRTELGRYGLSVSELQEWVATALGGHSAGIIYEGDRRFELVVRLPENIRQQTEQLSMLPIPVPHRSDETLFVPLQELATVEMSPGPAQISRENGKRRIVVTANVRERDLGSFVEEVRANVAANVDIPAGYWLEYGGTFEQLASASERLSLVVPVTLFMILALLVMAFSSLKDALIIFSGVPLALTGGILSLYLRGMPLSISAGVGFIALSGVAVLNGLVMLTFIRNLWHEGLPLQDAIYQGALTRLRPVLMTALVASLGFVPMAFNTGTGAEVQRPLATVVIGGIISSTLLTLVVLPALYSWVHQHTRLRQDRAVPADAF